MARLHELLAASGTLSGQADKTRADLISTFNSKKHHFGEKKVEFVPDSADEKNEVREQSSIQTTVHDEIEWICGKMAKAINVDHHIDVANTSAKADVVLEDGTVLLKDVPSTSLLQIGHTLDAVHSLIEAIPTLDPTKGFTPDPIRKGVFAARPVEKISTKKIKKVITLAPATDKHPAQVQVYDADDRVGVIHEQEWSSMITPALKSDLLDRCEVLQQAVKKARARANDTEVDTSSKIGNVMLSHIFDPLLNPGS